MLQRINPAIASAVALLLASTQAQATQPDDVGDVPAAEPDGADEGRITVTVY